MYFSHSGRIWSLDYTIFSEKQHNLSVFECYFTYKHSRRSPDSSPSLHCLPTTQNVAENNLTSLLVNNQPRVSEINGRMFRAKPFCWHESKSRTTWVVMVPMVTLPLFLASGGASFQTKIFLSEWALRIGSLNLKVFKIFMINQYFIIQSIIRSGARCGSGICIFLCSPLF